MSESIYRDAAFGGSGLVEQDIGMKIRFLNKLAVMFMDEVQRLGEAHRSNIERGFDFYEEVRRFEIDMIRYALTYTRGHQAKAAALLNLKATTLNSKIKQYGIPIYGAPGDAGGDAPAAS